MCRCAGYHVCGTHTKAIEGLYGRLTSAITRDDAAEARRCRGVLAGYGMSAELVLGLRWPV